ncbi:flagellar radial spoke protein 5-like [Pyrus communis]|uniref:flagellar radial spoke protein 5-like n=1 Tax=Pyrus communis TaxID=23211 RepID=UPI0035BF5682
MGGSTSASPCSSYQPSPSTVPFQRPPSRFKDINKNHVRLDLNSMVSTLVSDLGSVDINLKKQRSGLLKKHRDSQYRLVELQLVVRFPCFTMTGTPPSLFTMPPRRRANSVRCGKATQVSGETHRVTEKNGNDSLDICRVLNGMWQTSGGWDRIDRDDAVEAMLRYADAGLSTFDMADHYGPAEDLYGIFINRVRQERPPEYLEKVRGLTKWVPPPVKMTSSFVRDSVNVSRKRMDVASLDMLQFHWWDYANTGYLDALKHLTDLKEGKIKTVALTNFDTERLQIILENEIPVVSNQVQHSIVDMRSQQKMAELCQLTGVKLITYGTVMGGLLSEKFLDTNLNIPFAGPPLNTPSLQKYKRMVDAWGGWSLFQALLQTLKGIATKHGVSIATRCR